MIIVEMKGWPGSQPMYLQYDEEMIQTLVLQIRFPLPKNATPRDHMRVMGQRRRAASRYTIGNYLAALPEILGDVKRAFQVDK